MPRGDGTGPLGRGAMSGRGMGLCTGMNMAGRGFGMGLGLLTANRGLRNRASRRGASMGPGLCRWMGYGFRNRLAADSADNFYSAKSQKELLEEEKSVLERRLNILEKQLTSMTEVDE